MKKKQRLIIAVLLALVLVLTSSLAVLADEKYMPFTPRETGEQEYGVAFAPLSNKNTVNLSTDWSKVQFEGLKTSSTDSYYLAVQSEPLCYGKSVFIYCYVVTTIPVELGGPSTFDNNINVETIKLYDSDQFSEEHQVDNGTQPLITASGKSTYQHPVTKPNKEFRSSFVVSIYTKALTYGQDYYLVLDKGIPDKDGKTLADKVAIKFTIAHNYVDGKCSICGEEEPKPEPSNTWISFPEDVSFIDADENADYYQAANPLSYKCDGTVSFVYSVDGSKKYGHVRVQNPDGTSPKGVTVDEPDDTSRTATIAGLVPGTEYRLFWDKNEVSNKLTKNVAMSFKTSEEAVPPHTDEVISTKPATCTEPGLTEGKKCSVCGEILEEQKEIPAKGHTEETIPGKAATCTEKGLTDGKKCSVCGEILEEQKEIPALGHDYKDGVCTRCGEKDPTYVEPTPEEPADTDLVVKTVDGKQIAVRGTKSTEKASDYTGIAPELGNKKAWWRVVDGDVVPDATGVFKNEYGWWRVENGKVNFDAQEIYKNEYGWWKTTNGKVTFDETGVFQNEYGWWRVEDSKVNFKAEGIYRNDYGWWKTTKGKVTFKENGVFKNEYGWWKVEKSKVNFNFTGIASNEYGTWYVKNGKVDFSKNGKVTYNGKTYNVTDGKAKLA